MKVKTIYRHGLIRLANSKFGPQIQEFLRGSSEIVDFQAGRKFRSEMSERLTVSDLTSHGSSIEKEDSVSSFVSNTDRIKVRFYHCSASTFNVIQTVCDSFINDKRFDVLIVLFGFSYSEMVKQMKDGGYNYIEEYKYDITKDLPDISITYHPEIAYPPGLKEIGKYSKYFVLLPLSIGSIWFGDRTVRRLNLDFFKADLCFVGNLCYDRLIGPIGKDHIELMTPPQFDLSYKVLSAPKEYPNGWEKLQNKKTVILMTDHGLKKNLISDEVTFDLYFHALINYYKTHLKEGLILRLHPALLNELLGTYWTVSDYKSFIEFCDKSPNIVWDESSDYLKGLSIADGVIVDVNCSLVYYVLAANKPIAVPYRYDMNVDVNNPELVSHYYSINDTQQLNNYLVMIGKGEDPMKDKRQEAFDKYIYTYDGRNGYRIYKKIIERFLSNK